LNVQVLLALVKGQVVRLLVMLEEVAVD